VLWGEKALIPVSHGDQVEVYHATAKPGRFGGIELGAGRGSSICVPEIEPEPVVFEGTIIAGPGCTFIDNGTERYLIEGDLRHGSEVQVRGIRSGSRIIPKSVQAVEIRAEDLLLEIQGFKKELAM
jgi:replication factor A1